MQPTPQKDTVVIYHADCPDGFGAAYAAWKKFGDTASYLPWKEHTELPPNVVNKEVYVVDFSFREPLLKQLNDTNTSVVVIDHHQTAKDTVTAYPQNIFDINHSGCVLAWQYFHPTDPVPSLLLYLEDYDIWNLALPEQREFTVALRQIPMTFLDWDELVTNLNNENFYINFIAKGSLLAKYEDNAITNILKNKERVLFEGHEVWAVNEAQYKDYLGNQLAELNAAEGKIAIGIVYRRRAGMVLVSIRSSGDVDVATMAEKFGGGGHKNAAAIKVNGFADLPFKFLE